MRRVTCPLLLLPMLAIPAASGVAGAARAEVVAASGRWAVMRGAAACEAMSLAEAGPPAPAARGRLALAFGGAPQLAVRLARPVADGASVMLAIGEARFLLRPRGGWAWSRDPAQALAVAAALRGGGAAMLVSRDTRGVRFTHRFSLDGAASAVDGAAACGAALAKARQIR